MINTRRYFSLFALILFCFFFILQTAEAKRFGGGRSFGTQRSSSSYSHSPSHSPSMAGAAAKPASLASKWLGPLAGLAAGGLLASLFMGNGIGTGILTWLLLGGAILFILSLFRNKTSSHQPQPQPISPNQFNENRVYDSPAASASYPLGFEPDAFLRDAKVQFIRLQAAYDKKNLNDLCEFTSPEVFGEIQLQLHERGSQENITEVITLNAELLGAKMELGTMVASVQFSGLIREEVNQEPVSLNETWHFQKENLNPRWIVTGISQSAN